MWANNKQGTGISSLFLLDNLSELSRPLFTYLQDLYYRENNKISLLDISLISEVNDCFGKLMLFAPVVDPCTCGAVLGLSDF